MQSPSPLPRRAALLSLLPALAAPRPAAARIEARLLSSSATTNVPPDRDAAGYAAPAPRRARAPPPPPRPPRPEEHAVATEAADMLARMKEGEAAQAAGRYDDALASFEAATAAHPDLALTHLARTRAALLRYQTGDAPGALLELEDVEAVLRGRGEVHAAIAVVRYALHRAGAEAEGARATALEPRWGNDGGFVRGRWPPRMVEAWQNFSELK